jgi:hypothetical protein
VARGRFVRGVIAVIVAAVICFGLAEFVWWGEVPPVSEWGESVRALVALYGLLIGAVGWLLGANWPESR